MIRTRKNNIYFISLLIFVLILSSCSKTLKPTESTGSTEPTVSMESEVSMESKVSKDNLSATDDKVTIVFSEIDLSEETVVSMKEVVIPNVKDLDASVLTYNFTVDEISDFIGIIDIEMPYDSIGIDEGESPLNCVEAAYFNESSGKWESVAYSINLNSSTVTIYAEHLSTYGVFTFKNPKTRNASAFYDEYEVGYPILDIGDSNYTKVIQEYIDNDGETGAYAFGLGVSLMNDTLGIGGNSLTLLTETIIPPIQLDTLSKAFEKAGLAAALYQVVVDYQSGNNVAMAGNATKNVSYYAVSKLGSSAAKVASVGVFAIDYSINKFATEAWAGRTEIYNQAYEMYYGEKRNEARRAKNSIERQFYNKFYKAYEANLADGGSSDDLNNRINSILDEYVNEFWQDELTVGIYYQQVTDNVVGAGGGLNDKLMKDISENAKKELVKTSLAPVFRTLSKNISLKLHAEYVAEMKNVETMLNEVTEIKIYEENAKGKESTYKFANGSYRFSPLDSDTKFEDWSGKLDNNGQATTTFTMLGHIQSGMPDEIKFYIASLDPEIDDPTKIVSIPFGSDKISINIGLSPPSLDDLVGEWNDLEFNSLTVNDLSIPWDEIQNMIDEAKAEEEKGNDSECDFIEIDINEARTSLAELPGTVEPMVFNIVKTNETDAILNMTSFPEDTEGQCEQATAMPLPFKYNDGELAFDANLLNQYIASQNSEDLGDTDFKITSIRSDVTATVISETKFEKIIGLDGEFELLFTFGFEQTSLDFSIVLGVTGQKKINLTTN